MTAPSYEQIEDFLKILREIAGTGPRLTGLEGLAVSLADQSLKHPIGRELSYLNSNLSDLHFAALTMAEAFAAMAEALNRIADKEG